MFSECDIQMISQDDTADVVSSTTDGQGNGFSEPFVPNPDVSNPTISYAIKAVNDEVKFFEFTAKVWNVNTIKVFVLDADNKPVAPINPRNVRICICKMHISFNLKDDYHIKSSFTLQLLSR